MCDTGFCDDAEARRDDHEYINDSHWEAMKENWE